MSTWRILSSTPGSMDVAHRATDGARVAVCHLAAGVAPTDAHFDEAFAFAVTKWKAKR